MFTELNVFKMAHAMATHAGKRQALIAQNVANADTPGYKARDLVPFQAYTKKSNEGGLHEMRASRPGHLNGRQGSSHSWAETVVEDAVDLSSNDVSIETQMVNAVNAKRQHDRALAIYKSSLNVLRASLGRS
ncbi:MAG: FlgB family protein [Rhodobacteraceae bacterium]|nr:FlgB family protein [Paracoccaceae bacterium]